MPVGDDPAADGQTQAGSPDFGSKKRLEKGLSYTEIAEKLGIHKVTVSRTLKGMTMKPRTVKLLADYLSVEMEGIVQ